MPLKSPRTESPARKASWALGATLAGFAALALTASACGGTGAAGEAAGAASPGPAPTVTVTATHTVEVSATETVETTATETVRETVTEQAPAPGGGGGRTRDEFYENCDAARAAGAAPVREGDPGYGPHLDRDGDGVGCE